MKWNLLALIASAGVLVSGECPNQCSGHGRCTNYQMELSTASDSVPSIKKPAASASISVYGYNLEKPKKDSCTCFTRVDGDVEVYAYLGPDCSQRTCPHGPSWASPAIANNNHNIYEECSGKGSCDRNTGICQCTTGFVGKACQRQSCSILKDCSGHGRCKTLNELGALALAATGNTKMHYKAAWDADRSLGCECDTGYQGPTCSEVSCSSSEDPLGGHGAKDGRTCSGRGECDLSVGECKCFPGFFGESCQFQYTSM